MSQRVEKVIGWINGTVKDRIMVMHLYRQIWREVARVIEENGSLPPSIYWQYHLDVYMEAQLVAVRRQADIGRDAASLARLMMEVQKAAPHLTMDLWLGLDASSGDQFAINQWRTDFGGEIGEHLDPSVPAADLERLQNESSNVTAFVNEHVAHTKAPDLARPPQARAAPDTIAVREIHQAIDVIGDLFKKYSILLTAADWHMEEIQLSPDWLAPFGQAWLVEPPAAKGSKRAI